MKINIKFTLFIAILFLSLQGFPYGPSGSLPVLTITTEGGKPIADKENYLQATYSIDPKGDKNVEALSGTLQIRGRGNYTWNAFEKKPYKIKLDEKAKLLGFKKSKHFVLLAHADDNLGFLREPMGFRLSEMAALAWTPGQKPVELIINGDYRGLYFLVESIRIDKDRVDIFDQEDENPSTDVSGGWLCEIDNYEEPASEQITIREGNGNLIRITHHAPEEINAEQEAYLRQQMEALNRAFYIQDPASREFEKLVDLTSLVNYYVLQELMDGQEAFRGSCYFHRDRGEEKKWTWGPVWDFGNTYMRQEGRMIYEWPDWGQTWIDQIVKFHSFQEAYKKRFVEFLENDYEEIKAYVREYAATIEASARADYERWPQFGNYDVNQKVDQLIGFLHRRIKFLGGRWGIETNVSSGMYIRGDFNGWGADISHEFDVPVDGVYVANCPEFTGRFKIADYGWNPHNWGTVVVNQNIPLDTPIEIINGGESKDMVSPGGFKSVIFRILEPGQKATVELSSLSATEIRYPSADNPDVVILGNQIRIDDGTASIYDISGRCLARGVQRYEASAGLYLVVTPSRTLKIAIP